MHSTKTSWLNRYFLKSLSLIIILVFFILGCGGSDGGGDDDGNDINIEISNDDLIVDLYSVTIIWRTNVASTSQVEWGTAVDSLVNTERLEELVTDHSVTISGLSPDTTYFYLISSDDLGDNIGSYYIKSFSTPKEGSSGGIGPVGGTVTDAATGNKIEIPAGALTETVQIGITTVEGYPRDQKAVGDTIFLSPAGTVFNTPATVTVFYNESNVPNGYNEADHYLVHSDNLGADWTRLDSTVDVTENTVSARLSGFSLLGVSLEDKQLPVISNIVADFISANSARITWYTNEASDSVVYYGETTVYDHSVSDGTMVTGHFIYLTGLEPDTEYHYQVRSEDHSGNSQLSDDYTFKTEAVSDKYGSILVTSSVQGAAISIDGEDSGQVTPYTFGNFAVGAYTISVSLDGYYSSPKSIQVSVAENGTAVADFTLSEEVAVEMVLIPAGSFLMGDTFEEVGPYAQPVRTVYLDAYHIGKYEITFKQFDTFCEANERNFLPDNGYGRGQHPVNNTKFSDAVDFCNWLSLQDGLTPCYEGDECDFSANGYRLPTEAEWEKAAAWDDDLDVKRRYPWGDTWDCTKTNSSECGPNKSMYVGSYPEGISYYGLYDMAGNLYEWCNDWWVDSFEGLPDPDTNPRGPESGTEKVVKGGSFSINSINCRPVSRATHWNPEQDDIAFGFRIVRKLE